MSRFLEKCGKFFSWFYLFFVGILFPIILLSWGISDLSKMKNTTTGTVTDMGYCYNNNNNTKNCKDVTVKYTVDDQIYNETPKNSNYLQRSIVINSSVFVHYESSDPQVCTIHIDNYEKRGILLIFAAIFCSLLGVGIWYGVNHNATFAKIFCLTSLLGK